MPILTRQQVLSACNCEHLNHAPNQTASLGFLSGGADSISQTIALMVKLVKQYRKDPQIRALSESIIQDVPEKDAVGEVRAVFNWVRDNIRYTQDVRDVETLKTPDATIYSAQGDCDDQSTLFATLVETIGYAARFVAVGMSEPGVYEHVYSEVKLGTRWIGADTTENVSLGWVPPNPVAIMIRHI